MFVLLLLLEQWGPRTLNNDPPPQRQSPLSYYSGFVGQIPGNDDWGLSWLGFSFLKKKKKREEDEEEEEVLTGPADEESCLNEGRWRE